MSQFVAQFEEILDAAVFDEEAAEEACYQYSERCAEGYVPTADENRLFGIIEDKLTEVE